MNLIDSFLEKSGLTVKRWEGEQAVCLCPMCGSSDSSGHLYVKAVGDRILLNDRRGDHCAEDICASIGLRMSDLFAPKPRRERIASREHVYQNPDGSTFGKKIITSYSDGKKGVYWQRYVDGEYRKGLDGHKAPLYRVPQILKTPIDTPIVFVEGEKDCENLARMGYTGTTAPNGGEQKKWLDTFNVGLKGHPVFIITDNDIVGKGYGQFIAKHTFPIAKSVCIIPAESILPNLKKKGDISDIIDEVGLEETSNRLKNAMREAVPYSPDNESSENEDKPRGRTVKEIVTSETVKEIISQMGVTIRLNLISNKVEIDGLPDKYSKTNAVNTLPTKIMDVFKENDMRCDLQFLRNALAMIADEYRYNPIEDMLKKTQWDGKDRVSQYIETLRINSERDTIYIRKWLHQTVAMPLNDENEPIGADGVLTFCGEQGTGKTTAFRVLAVRPDWFCEGARIDMDKTDTLIRATGRWICEIGEADDTTKKEQAALKSFLTATSDEIRFPYASEAVCKPRRTSFCATVNSERFLPANDGSRRWWIVHTGDIDYKTLLNLPPEWFIQMWAQVYQTMYLPNPPGFRLTDSEKITLQADNAKYKRILPGELEVLEKLDFDAEEFFWKWWKTSELRECLKIYNVPVNKLGEALTKISTDYPKIRTKTVHKICYYYLPPFLIGGPENGQGGKF